MVKKSKEEKEKERRDKRIASHNRSIERAREKQREKQNSEAWQKEQREKKYASQQKRYKRQQEKMSSPEYIAEQKRKQKELNETKLAKEIAKRKKNAKTPAQLAAQERNTENIVKRVKRPISSKKLNSKGILGRTPTAGEKRMADKLGELPCICCTILKEQGKIRYFSDVDGLSNYISLHHCDGRVKKNAHYKQLPLCQYHHDTSITPEQKKHAEFKYLVPIHAKGTWGGLGAWSDLFGSEVELLERCYAEIGEAEFFEENLK